MKEWAKSVRIVFALFEGCCDESDLDFSGLTQASSWMRVQLSKANQKTGGKIFIFRLLLTA
ncbi:MAG: hypothetical protein ACRD82_06760, partial [Blastocatellia bacterium]